MESCSEKSYKSVKIWQNYGHESVAHSLWSVSFLAHPVVVHDFAGNEVLLQCTVQFTLVLDEMSSSTEFNVVLYASVMKWKLLTDFEVREYETSRFITFFPPFPPEKQMASVTVHQPASTPPHRSINRICHVAPVWIPHVARLAPTRARPKWRHDRFVHFWRLLTSVTNSQRTDRGMCDICINSAHLQCV